MKIEKKDLYKTKRVTIKYAYGDHPSKDVVGIVVPVIPEGYKVIAESGDVYDKYYKILKISTVRNISKTIRDILDSIGQIVKEKNKEQERLIKARKEIQERIDNIEKKRAKSLESLRLAYTQEYSLLTTSSFDDAINKLFEETIKGKLRKENYTFGQAYNYVSSYEDSMEFELELYSEKYARDGALGVVYSEYDGSMHVSYSDEEARNLVALYLGKSNISKSRDEMDSVAKKIMKDNKGLEVSVIDKVDIGDKNTLVIGLNIKIKYNENYKKDKKFLEIIENTLKEVLG